MGPERLVTHEDFQTFRQEMQEEWRDARKRDLAREAAIATLTERVDNVKEARDMTARWAAAANGLGILGTFLYSLFGGSSHGGR